MTAEKFFATALTHIESTSIRAWAQSEHNRPHVIKACQDALAKNRKADPQLFAVMLVCIAMG